MALTINTNIASIHAQRQLAISQTNLSQSMQRLSSGMRINTAADDVAGLAISENMRGQIRSMNQAVRNANDGISLIQTAEGALNETSAILVRMRELAQQSSTGTVGSAERGYIQSEMNKLTLEIDRIAGSTEFNGTKLLNGNLSDTGHTSSSTNNSAASDTSGRMTFQIGARNGQTNMTDVIDLNIQSATTSTLMGGSAATTTVSVSTQASAQAALDKIDAAIISISSERSNLGATQNRLQSTINNLQVSIENTSAAESRIRDTDVASETAIMTRNNILTQAGTAILSQANQAPQAALQLLR